MNSPYQPHYPLPDFSALKAEKLSSPLNQNFPQMIQSALRKSSPEPKSISEKRSRLYTQSRTDIACESRSSYKKSQDPKDIERCSVSKVPFLPFLSIRTNAIEELYKEIKDLKVLITEQDERNRISSQCIETGKIKLKELKDRYSVLNKKSGQNLTPTERREELSQKLKRTQQKWVKNSLKLKSRILELEDQSKKLEFQAESISSQIFQKAEHQKVIISKLNESERDSENGYCSCEAASHQTNSFAYTPSYNSLCLA